MKKYLLTTTLLIATLSVNAQKVSSSIDSTKLVSAKKQLTTFFRALNIAGMDSIFKGAPKTILAPDDEAFEKLPAGMLDSLLKPANQTTFNNQTAIVRLLLGHIIPGKLDSKDIARLIHENNGQTVFNTTAGIKLTAKINANRNIVLTDESGNEFVVKQFDIADGNAFMFIISSVIPIDKTRPIKL